MSKWRVVQISVINGPDAGKVFTSKVIAEIGRDSSNQVHLSDSLISRNHATVESTSRGTYVFTDHSRNGTYYVKAGSSTPDCTVLNDSIIMKPGDMLMLGQTKLRLDLGVEISITENCPVCKPTSKSHKSSSHHPDGHGSTLKPAEIGGSSSNDTLHQDSNHHEESSSAKWKSSSDPELNSSKDASEGKSHSSNEAHTESRRSSVHHNSKGDLTNSNSGNHSDSTTSLPKASLIQNVTVVPVKGPPVALHSSTPVSSGISNDGASNSNYEVHSNTTALSLVDLVASKIAEKPIIPSGSKTVPLESGSTTDTQKSRGFSSTLQPPYSAGIIASNDISSSGSDPLTLKTSIGSELLDPNLEINLSNISPTELSRLRSLAEPPTSSRPLPHLESDYAMAVLRHPFTQLAMKGTGGVMKSRQIEKDLKNESSNTSDTRMESLGEEDIDDLRSEVSSGTNNADLATSTIVVSG